jgi:hypothetical protein
VSARVCDKSVSPGSYYYSGHFPSLSVVGLKDSEAGLGLLVSWASSYSEDLVVSF